MDGNNLINTKLHMPSLRDNHVYREVLNKKLTEGQQKGHKIILVSAEAGYGKTTLISGWISQINQSYTWLSLDEYDNDPIIFLNYLVIAIQKIDETFGRAIVNILNAPKLPGVEVISSYIIKELEKMKQTFILVFDDYHIINNDYIHKLMQRLLDSNLRNILTIILTRQEPPFTISRWRVRDRLTELSSYDLAFADAEIKDFFSKNFDISFDEDILKLLEERTEGWAAGLQMIGLSVKNIKGLQARDFIEQFNGNNRYIVDYLMDEVFNIQEDQVRTFLKETSVLKSFNEELCNTITGLDCSKKIIEQLERENLFIIPLDSSRTWYRYHNLFSEFLRSEFDEQQKIEIYKKASIWYKEKGLAEMAIEYAIEANDGEMALSLLKPVSLKYFQDSRIGALLELLKSVKKISNQLDVEEETCRAWCLFLLGNTDEAYRILKELESKQEIEDPFILGKIQALGVMFYKDTDSYKAVKLAEEAVSNLKGESKFFYNIALRSLGLVKLSVGALTEATDTFKKIFQETNYKSYGVIELSAFLNYTACLIDMGRKQEAQALCEEALAEYTDQYGNSLPLAKMLYLTMGLSLYYGNELEKAQKYLHEGINFCREMGLVSTIGNVEGVYVKLLYILEKKCNAFKTVHKYKCLSKSLGFQNIFVMLEAIETDLNLKEKNYAKVFEWVKDREESLNNILCLYPGCIQLTYVRALIAQRKLNEAETRLRKVEDSARKCGRFEQLITILLLKALVKKREGNEGEALTCIKEALKIAVPQGYIRNFLDEEDDILDLIFKVRYVAPEFIDQLERENTKQDDVLIESLKVKEIEILKLMALGMSNAEIANSLYITIGTAKWYIKNIYGKLGVNRRTQAIIKARQLRIIT